MKLTTIIRHIWRVISNLDAVEWTMAIWFFAAAAILAMYGEEGDDPFWYWLSLAAPVYLLICYYRFGKGKDKYDWTKDL